MNNTYPKAWPWLEEMMKSNELLEHQRHVESNLAFARVVESKNIRPCGVCGLPTIITFVSTYCLTCYQLVCVTCQDGHVHNFGPPVGMPDVEF